MPAISPSAVGRGLVAAVLTVTLSLSAAPGWAANPAQPIWRNGYNGPDSRDDTPRQIAVDPGSGNVYVTGSSQGVATGYDYATVAYDAAGMRLWDARYNGPAGGSDTASAVAVDPTTGNVYVTGQSRGVTTGYDYATLAYSRTGTQLWVARYDGPGQADDAASAIAVDPGTGTVYVTGVAAPLPFTADFATVAYSAAGVQLWVAHYDGPAHEYDGARVIVVDAATGNVYVAGDSNGFGADYATVAYGRAGGRLWVGRYNGPANSAEFVKGLAVDPTTGNVYVTGASPAVTTGYDFATVAYTGTGEQLWVNRYSASATGFEGANAVAVDSSTGNVYVIGLRQSSTTGSDYATIAYTADGASLWSDVYNGPADADDVAFSVAVDSTSGNVYATGVSPGRGSHDIATLAYRANGARLGVARYFNPWQRASGVVGIAVDPSTGNVHVTGTTAGQVGTRLDYLVLAYPAP